MDITREELEKIFYDEYNMFAMKTCDPLFGDSENKMQELFNILENIFKDIEYVLSRISEILRNDSLGQSIIMKYKVQNILDSEKLKIENHKKLEKKRILKETITKNTAFDINNEDIEYNSFRKLDI